MRTWQGGGVKLVSPQHGRTNFMKIATRAACLRTTILLGLLGVFVLCCWLFMIRMPGTSYQGPWTPLSAEERALEQELRDAVELLGGKIGDRNLVAYEQLKAAVDYIERRLGQAGYAVRRQRFEAGGKECFNLEAERTGTRRADEIVVVGAHYDSVQGCPGANDNASGVAAVLALAGRFAKAEVERTLRFVAFVNEEPPYFQTAQMGSLVYARECRQRGDRIVAMLSLETIGYYTDQAGSQRYPFPIGLFYPSTGNFIAFVGDTGSSELVRRCVESFRRQAKFPSEGGALPTFLPGVGWSDHWAFWQAGYPAIMVTDTAPFRYAHYHEREDTPDKLAYYRLARVVAGLEKVIAELTIEP